MKILRLVISLCGTAAPNLTLKMNKIDWIKITGFRRLDAIDLVVKPFMTLIGTNGVGKTSFFDALTLLSSSAAGNLHKNLSQFGDIVNLQTRGTNQGLSFEEMMHKFYIHRNVFSRTSDFKVDMGLGWFEKIYFKAANVYCL
jgi:predicted ATPase